MTEVVFYFGVSDRLAFTCRLLRKVVGQGLQVNVLASLEVQRSLDSDLWTFSATDFIAHCSENAASLVQTLSAVTLASVLRTEGFFRPVLVNLLDSVPEGFERYQRLVEVVGTGEADRQNARVRWKRYARNGYQLQHHDVGASRMDA